MRNVTLVVWHAWPSPEQHILATLVDRYNQLHPSTQIILQAMPLASLTRELRTAALVGSGPHLVILRSHTIGALAEDGFLLPLDETMISAAERSKLLSTAIGSATAQGSDGVSRLYGIPLTFDTLALYHNRVNIDVPPPDMETLLDNAHDLTNASLQPPVWGLAYTLSLDKTIGYLYAFNGQVFDTEGNLVLGTEGRAGTERWLEWLMKMRQDDQILAVSDSIAVDSALKAQAALITIDWSHALSSYRSLWGDHLGVAMLPRLQDTDQPPQPYVQSDVVSLNARVVDSEEQQAALGFVEYLITEDAQQALLEAGKQPTLLNLSLEGETQAMQAARLFRAQAQQGQAMPNSRVANEIVRKELERMQLTVLRGLATPADAVTYANVTLQEHLQALP